MRFSNPQQVKVSIVKFLISATIFWCAAMCSAHAQSEACHALAASPSDPARKGVGVSYAKIDGIRAAAACRLAVEKFPEDGQLWFQYGRALEKVNRVPEAFVAYRTGADLGDLGAMNNLGELYRDGKGVARDLYMAEVLFENGAMIGFPEAAENLDALIKSKSPASTPIIPIQFRGKFSSPGRTCKEDKILSKAFDGAFIGIEVGDTQISHYMEFGCGLMNLTKTNPRQANVILRCMGNGGPLFLGKAMLSQGAIQFESSLGGGVSVRCQN
jgi:TPR repeat protein